VAAISARNAWAVGSAGSDSGEAPPKTLILQWKWHRLEVSAITKLRSEGRAAIT
jgi:hypothetical protein